MNRPHFGRPPGPLSVGRVRGPGIAIVAVWVFLAAVSTARAECGIFVGPCHEFKRAAAVFDGTVERLEHFSEEKTSITASGAVRPGFTVDLTRVKVHRSWKGVPAGQVVDVLGVAKGVLDTVVHLSVGERYLFYARRDGQGRLWAESCGRTRTLGNASDDVAHLESRDSLAGALAFGKVSARTGAHSDTPAAGVVVVLKGVGGERRTQTDAKGDFAFRDLPVGRYSISVDVLNTQAVIYPPSGAHEFNIHDKRECELAWITLGPRRE